MAEEESPSSQSRQGVPGGRLRWSRTATPTRPVSPLCETCQSLLVRPTCDPTAQLGLLDAGDQFSIHLYYPEASRAAANGCVLCKLVMALESICAERAERDTAWWDPPCGFELKLCWSSTASRFASIGVHPIDSYFREAYKAHSMYRIILTQQDEQQGCAIKYPSPLHTASQLCGDLAIRWFDHCTRNHAKCSERFADSDQLPTRLIDVGPLDGTQEPRLVLSSELQGCSDVRYITLSHRWASSEVLKLESTNVESLRRCIPLESLPQTFVDAIEVTRALSVRYIWVDSLCILQDAMDDWHAQAAEMGRVYKNGLCNLAATGAAATTENPNKSGLFQERDPHWVTPNQIRIRYQGHDSVYTFVVPELWGQCISASTLNRRGWVLQERMLSPRTLHFSKQLFWECREMQACETYPDGLPELAEEFQGTKVTYGEMGGFGLPATFKNWREECAQRGKRFWIWVVEGYGRCFITRPEDRLVAIAGAARSLQPLLCDDYIAGLWKKDLPWNLVWDFAGVVKYPQFPAKYRCPSWSWAALDYGSAYIIDLLIWDDEDNRVRPLVLIQNVHIEPLGPSEFCLLKGGYIEMKGRVRPLSPATVFGEKEGERIKGHHRFLCHFDVDHLRTVIPDGSLFCLPLLVRLQEYDGHLATIAECLLLQHASPDKQGYTRVGLLKVSLTLAYALPEELRWIVEFAESGLPLENEAIVTLY